MDAADRIAELEGQVADLQAELAALQPKPKPPPAPLREEVNICFDVPAPFPELPDAAETDRLLEILAAAWPRFRPAPEHAERYRVAFVAGLHFCSYAARHEKLNTSYGLASFVNVANDWLAKQVIEPRTAEGPFFAAAMCSKIAYSAPSRWPYDCLLALRPLSMLNYPICGWREVLQAGRVPAPTPLPYRVG